VKPQAASKIKDRSRQWLFEALMELMKTKSYQDITISDLCRQADLTRPTFYRHFTDKDDVIIQYFRILFEELYASIEGEPDLTVRKMLLIYLEFWKKHETFSKLLVQSQCDSNSVHCNLLFVRRSLRKITLPEHYDRRQFELFLAGGLYNCLEHWIDEDMAQSPKELCDQIMGFLSVENYPN